MLSKLFKHEMKATARLLLPIYLILVVLTIMDRIALNLDIFTGTLAVIPGFITFMYIMSIIAIVVVSFVIIILRFYKNLLTDEGYLMFTLPAHSKQLINSKLFASMFWTLASMVGVIISLLGVFATSERMNILWDGIKMAFAELKMEFGSTNTTIFIVEFVVMIVIGLINNILEIYASIAVGQLFNRHKVLGSFGAYIAITTALQIIVSVILSVVGLLYKTRFDDISAIPEIVFPITILYLLVTNILFYCTTDFIFKKKLNLD